MRYLKTIVGTEAISFTGRDGQPVRGTKVHYTEPLAPGRGAGLGAGNFFLSDARLASIGITLKPGLVVEAFYNRFGKVETLCLVDEDEDLVKK